MELVKGRRRRAGWGNISPHSASHGACGSGGQPGAGPDQGCSCPCPWPLLVPVALVLPSLEPERSSGWRSRDRVGGDSSLHGCEEGGRKDTKPALSRGVGAWVEFFRVPWLSSEAVKGMEPQRRGVTVLRSHEQFGGGAPSAEARTPRFLQVRPHLLSSGCVSAHICSTGVQAAP